MPELSAVATSLHPHEADATVRHPNSLPGPNLLRTVFLQLLALQSAG